MFLAILCRYKGQVSDLTWEKINQHYATDCPNILQLVDLILSIPATSAENERGFSVMKLTKNKFRSRLISKSLNDRLTICLLTGKTEDFDPAGHVERWYRSANRRCGQQSTQEATTDSESSDDEAEPHFDELADDTEISENDVEMFMENIDATLNALDDDYE